MALTKTKILYLWRLDSYGQFTINSLQTISIADETNSMKYIKNMTCGYNYSIITTIFGEIYSWGYNECGQLGLGDKLDRHKPCKLKLY